MWNRCYWYWLFMSCSSFGFMNFFISDISCKGFKSRLVCSTFFYSLYWFIFSNCDLFFNRYIFYNLLLLNNWDFFFNSFHGKIFSCISLYRYFYSSFSIFIKEFISFLSDIFSSGFTFWNILLHNFL